MTLSVVYSPIVFSAKSLKPKSTSDPLVNLTEALTASDRQRLQLCRKFGLPAHATWRAINRHCQALAWQRQNGLSPSSKIEHETPITAEQMLTILGLPKSKQITALKALIAKNKPETRQTPNYFKFAKQYLNLPQQWTEDQVQQFLERELTHNGKSLSEERLEQLEAAYSLAIQPFLPDPAPIRNRKKPKKGASFI